MVVSISDRDVRATNLARNMEAEALALAAPVLSCANAQEQTVAVQAQTELARYVKAVHAAAEAAKKPLNELRSKIIAMDKELVAKAEAEGARVGQLLADFDIAEQTRVAALRRLQTLEATKLEQEQDKRLSEANSVAEQDAIRDEFRDELAAAAPPVEPIRAPGQVVKEEWEIQVSDIWLLARAMPSCVKMEPRLSEIKSLLNAGIKVPGVTAVKKIVAGVRLAPQPQAINV
jgi:hypothetical protein